VSLTAGTADLLHSDVGVNHRSLALALGLGALAACDASSNETVACAESLSAYCDAAPCVLQIDRNNVGGSFCASQPAPFVTFAPRRNGSLRREPRMSSTVPSAPS